MSNNENRCFCHLVDTQGRRFEVKDAKARNDIGYEIERTDAVIKTVISQDDRIKVLENNPVGWKVVQPGYVSTNKPVKGMKIPRGHLRMTYADMTFVSVDSDIQMFYNETNYTSGNTVSGASPIHFTYTTSANKNIIAILFITEITFNSYYISQIKGILYFDGLMKNETFTFNHNTDIISFLQ